MVFASALLERMLPHYAMFARASDFGDAHLLRNQLNLVWQKLDSKQSPKINVEAQLLKLEEHIPSPEDYDMYAAYPALDAAMALLALLQAVNDKDANVAETISRLSQASVTGYVELDLSQQAQAGDTILQSQIKAHPLSEWEKAIQNELFDLVKDTDTQQVIEQAKSLVLEEGLSSLGFEID